MKSDELDTVQFSQYRCTYCPMQNVRTNFPIRYFEKLISYFQFLVLKRGRKCSRLETANQLQKDKYLLF